MVWNVTVGVRLLIRGRHHASGGATPRPASSRKANTLCASWFSSPLHGGRVSKYLLTYFTGGRVSKSVSTEEKREEKNKRRRRRYSIPRKIRSGLTFTGGNTPWPTAHSPAYKRPVQAHADRPAPTHPAGSPSRRRHGAGLSLRDGATNWCYTCHRRAGHAPSRRRAERALPDDLPRVL